jgi:hypothetical protein
MDDNNLNVTGRSRKNEVPKADVLFDLVVSFPLLLSPFLPLRLNTMRVDLKPLPTSWYPEHLCILPNYTHVFPYHCSLGR